MSRVFWMVVGAAGGVVAYRRGTRAVARAKELGPLGTAQVAARATSKLAGRTANGLGRLNDIKAQREGRLVIGSAEDVSNVARPVPTDWVPAPSIPGSGGTTGHGGPAPSPPAAGRSTAGAVPRTRRARRDGSEPITTRDGTS